VRIWDLRGLEDGRLAHAWVADRNRVTACGAYGAGQLATGGRDGTLRLWAFDSGKSEWRCARTVSAHPGGVLCLDHVSNFDTSRGERASGGGAAGPARLPPLVVGGARTGQVKLFHLGDTPPPPSAAPAAAEGGHAAAPTPEPLGHYARAAQAAAALAAAALASVAEPEEVPHATVRYDAVAPRPVQGSGWAPAWGDEVAGPAHVAAVASFGLHLTGRGPGRRLMPRTLAAAVRSDVVVWTLPRGDGDDDGDGGDDDGGGDNER
jgi:hypothetical protein